MGSEPRKRTPRTAAWVITVAMVLTITSQVILLITQSSFSPTTSWVILILSGLVLAYAVYLLIKKDPTLRNQQ